MSRCKHLTNYEVMVQYVQKFIGFLTAFPLANFAIIMHNYQLISLLFFPLQKFLLISV